MKKYDHLSTVELNDLNVILCRSLDDVAIDRELRQVALEELSSVKQELHERTITANRAARQAALESLESPSKSETNFAVGQQENMTQYVGRYRKQHFLTFEEVQEIQGVCEAVGVSLKLFFCEPWHGLGPAEAIEFALAKGWNWRKFETEFTRRGGLVEKDGLGDTYLTFPGLEQCRSIKEFFESTEDPAEIAIKKAEAEKAAALERKRKAEEFLRVTMEKIKTDQKATKLS